VDWKAHCPPFATFIVTGAEMREIPHALLPRARVGAMVALPIPTQELKSGTWYFGLRCCACDRLHVLCEDLFAAKREAVLQCERSFEVVCECGAVAAASRLHKFRTPQG
jgi:hypothetical protein